MVEPVIKWSGSKRSQASEIIKYFPKEIETYYEPFCGGASMLRALLDSNIKCKNYIASDLNNDLITLWDCIKNNPQKVYTRYQQLWSHLNKDGDLNRKKKNISIILEKSLMKQKTHTFLCS